MLRGWGEYFRSGNAARKFLHIDTYVWERLRRFLMRRAGRNLRAGRAAQWTREWFWGQGVSGDGSPSCDTAPLTYQ
ncbi:MAG: group II intron maturase-specific domain-containing protein [Candidatus Limnocylindria bacterium]